MKQTNSSTAESGEIIWRQSFLRKLCNIGIALFIIVALGRLILTNSLSATISPLVSIGLLLFGKHELHKQIIKKHLADSNR